MISNENVSEIVYQLRMAFADREGSEKMSIDGKIFPKNVTHGEWTQALIEFIKWFDGYAELESGLTIGPSPENDQKNIDDQPVSFADTVVLKLVSL